MKPPRFVLRRYCDHDLEDVATLLTASVHQVAASHYDEAQRAAWAPQPPDLERFQRRLAPLETLVAEMDSRLAGFLSYAPCGHIELLFVSPDFVRRGVASALFGQTELELAASGVKELTTEASLVARPFFERQGFSIVEEQAVERNGVFLRRFAMRKTLPSRLAQTE